MNPRRPLSTLLCLAMVPALFPFFLVWVLDSNWAGDLMKSVRLRLDTLLPLSAFYAFAGAIIVSSYLIGDGLRARSRDEVVPPASRPKPKPTIGPPPDFDS